MPKPWPEKPVPITRPGKVSTFEMTGITSGIVSIMPPHFSTMGTVLSAGIPRRMWPSTCLSRVPSGVGSRTRIVS